MVAGAPNRAKLHRKPEKNPPDRRDHALGRALSLEGPPHGPRRRDEHRGRTEIRHFSRPERLVASPGNPHPTRQFHLQVRPPMTLFFVF